MKYCVIYARYSSANQREESIDAQIRAVTEYALKNNIKIVGTFADEAQSGKSDLRDEFQQMIESIILGDIKVDAVLVHKFNRFARDTFDSAIYKRKLKDIGVRVVSVTQPIDDSPEGALLERFLEAIDEYYSANLALEVKKGLRENALKGRRVGGKVPLGFYVGEDGYYKIDKTEAQVVRRVFDDFAAGVSTSQICRCLNSEGVRSKQGDLFRVSTIADMLKNEKYAGVFKYKISKHETITVLDVVPRIIDPDVWAVVQSKLKKRLIPRPNKTNNYVLTGKAFCLSCGCSISGAGGGKKLKSGERLWYYECTGKTSQKNGCSAKKINKKWIEQAVTSEILKVAFSEKTLKKIATLAFTEIKKTNESSGDSVANIKSLLKQNADQQRRLALLFMKSKIDADILETEEILLLEEKTALELRLAHINSVVASAGITEDDVYSFILSYVEQLKKAPAASSPELVESLIRAFVERVDIDDENVKIQLRLDFFNLRFDGCGNARIAGAIRGLSHLFKTVIISRSSIAGADIGLILTKY